MADSRFLTYLTLQIFERNTK